MEPWDKGAQQELVVESGPLRVMGRTGQLFEGPSHAKEFGFGQNWWEAKVGQNQ